MGGPLSDAQARRFRREHEDYSKLIKEGGYWWLHVQEWIADRDNDAAKLEQLKPMIEAQKKQSAATISAILATLRR